MIIGIIYYDVSEILNKRFIKNRVLNLNKSGLVRQGIDARKPGK